ncbi:golgin subfamily A member 6-like protein 7 [Boleophthalmus pectinirostris]|uniref:golgin subfamily A member 6-like protein 7 n=1 Tax=Boleophthalmus pectinirostris TaxID=150288 RepID=UPI0024308044|nr:golgin subfamily A member 6-like protein 7 [Boleophthalmus pectinirostris]
MVKLFRTSSSLVKDLRGRLSTAEETIHALQNEIEKERAERATVERALHESNITSKNIQEETDQRTVHLEAELEKINQTQQNALVEKEKEKQIQEHKQMTNVLQDKLRVESQRSQQLQKEVSRLDKENWELNVKCMEMEEGMRSSSPLTEANKITVEDGKKIDDLEEVVSRLQNEDENERIWRVVTEFMEMGLEDFDNKLQVQIQINKRQIGECEESKRQLRETEARNKCLQEKIASLEDELHQTEMILRRSEEMGQRALEEERERSAEMEKALREKDNIIRHLQDVIEKEQITKPAMVEDFQSMKEAIVTLEQSTEEQRSQFQCELDLKEEKNRKLEKELSAAKNILAEQSTTHQEEVEHVRDDFKRSVQKARMRSEKDVEDISSQMNKKRARLEMELSKNQKELHTPKKVMEEVICEEKESNSSTEILTEIKDREPEPKKQKREVHRQQATNQPPEKKTERLENVLTSHRPPRSRRKRQWRRSNPTF